MKHKINALLALLALFFFSNKSSSQELSAISSPPFYSYVFDTDSLSGFDEEAARRSALSEDFYGAEFKVRMFQLKRRYVNDKYDLVKPIVIPPNNFYVAKSAVVPECQNEDFEGATGGTVTTSTQVLGWTITRGTNNSGVVAGANSCNLLGCCTSAPLESAVYDVANGFTDPVIGAQYPIFSVFGTAAGDPAAETSNPQINQGMFGNKFIRVNSEDLGGNNAFSIEKLSKTFSVTSNNALFQFAFISVFSTGHTCCDAGAFQIRLLNATSNQVIACPNFSASAPSNQCTTTATGVQYLQTNNGQPVGTNYNGDVFNKWHLSSMDLTPYIGQNITIEIVATDCTAGGHYGYVYFDAQCGPMVVYGNNTPYAAGTNSINVPTCGATGATLCAPAGLGPYYWNGPDIPVNSSTAVPAYSNVCIVTTVSATYTLSMQPAGACAPITRVINSKVTPAPGVFADVVQATCGNSLAVVNVTPSGSASAPGSIIWSPIPLAMNSTTTTGTFIIPPQGAPQTVTISVYDSVACKATATVNVMPAPPIPTFAVNNSSPSYSITCSNPTINLNAVTGYTYGNLDYFWASASSTFNTSDVEVITPGNYTITATDPVSLCSNTVLVAVSVNTTAPLANLSPTLQNITCSVTSVVQTTITTTNASVSITHQVLSPLGGSFVSNNYQTTYLPQGVGVYSVVTINDLNGCSSMKTLTISSNQGFPTFSVQSPQNFTLGCSTTSVAWVDIVGGSATNSMQVPNGGPVSYTLLAPSASSTLPSGTLSPTASYTVITPGTYTVVTRDNTSSCETRVPISILSYTNGPDIDTVLIPTRILTCATPSVTLEAASLTPSVSYNWIYSGVPGNLPSNSITINANFSVAASNTLINNYTLSLTNNVNKCITTSVIPIWQNIFKPNAIATNGGVGSISCKNYSLTLTNQSTSNIPAGSGFPTGNAVVGAQWHGPTPQASASLVSTYVALTVGTYTMIARDMGNGCESTATVSVADDRNYPNINENKPSTFVIDCGANATLQAVSVPSTGVTYSWHPPEGGTLSSYTLAQIIVQKPGQYLVLVTNTLNGCATYTTVGVISNTVLTTEFDLSEKFGYAPLTVNFVNNSRSDNGSGGIISTWSFGNGTSSVTPSASISPSAIYTQPGSYTVTLYANKGSCADTTRRIVNVEIPSKLTVPNVFTPNGDGVNDLYFLRINNLTHIAAVIYDRWGGKIYEVDTRNTKNNAAGKENVNIAWDGKNQLDVEVPEGTYFYVIEAKGKDGKEYKEKGTINLIR